ncbi:MAG: tripartite tricarboxylate transporter substrate binding protein [Rubrivivax sp.]|nr:tripartite tricarboxylate transporter substrate binding protein [Rubrivivax sp.]
MNRRRFHHRVLAGAASAAAAAFAPPLVRAQAPAWPSKTVRIVHGFTAGGPVDALARLVAQQFTERFGQQAIVEGKPGAGGTLGAQFVARSEPDGHTLFLMASGHSAAPGLYKSLPFDPVGDFTMTAMVARSPFAIIAGPAAAFATVQEMVAKAKAEPGKVDYGSGGIGSGMHLAAVLMQSRGGFELNHVPYKGGSAPALAAIAGEVPIIYTSMAGMAQHLQAGKLRALAVTSKQRFALAPSVPTVAETVVPEFDVSAWYALAGPKGLPAPVVARLNEMVQSTLARPEIADGLRAQAAIPWPASAAEAQAFLAADVARWTKVIAEAKIVVPG